MGYIWRTYNYGSRSPDTAVLIQCVKGREPVAHELWCHGLAGLCRKFHLTARVYITTGNVVEFIAKYMTADRWRNRIIVHASFNGSVQFLDLPEVWGSSLP